MKCSRCGRCCLYEIDGKVKRCRFLIGEIGKRTSCRVYHNRYWKLIDKGKNSQGQDVNIRCGNRKDQTRQIKECTLRDDKL